GGTLTIRVRPGHDGVRIEGADDGPGGPPDDTSRALHALLPPQSPRHGRGPRLGPGGRPQRDRRARRPSLGRESPRRRGDLRDGAAGQRCGSRFGAGSLRLVCPTHARAFDPRLALVPPSADLVVISVLMRCSGRLRRIVAVLAVTLSLAACAPVGGSSR